MLIHIRWLFILFGTMYLFTSSLIAITKFTVRDKASMNLKGNVRIIGNTVLQYNSANPQQLTNSNIILSYVDIDNNQNTFNSSSATIDNIYADVDITNARIQWAGLYWQGYLHRDNADAGIDNNFRATNF